MHNRYYIAGPFVDDEALFWNNDTGWGSFESASCYGREVFITPLPLEGVAVWELTPDGEPVECWPVDCLPRWGMN
jgi:hypothetical protein